MKIKDVEIEVVRGDITQQVDIDVIVNAANAYLTPGGGVSGAIHDKAGPKLYEECKKLAPIKTGQAVITSGYNLPNPYVIHTLGPIYLQEKNPSAKLAECYKNCLKLADGKNLRSIAFPAISTGGFGYPVKEGAIVALQNIIEEIPKLKSIKKIRFVLFDEGTYKIFKETLDFGNIWSTGKF